jgi:hypothetical protein
MNLSIQPVDQAVPLDPHMFNLATESSLVAWKEAEVSPFIHLMICIAASLWWTDGSIPPRDR